jgi:hypothetical protein
VTQLDAGILRLERIFLTAVFFALTYVLLFFASSRLGFVHGRHLFAFAAAAAAAGLLLRWVLPPRTIPTKPDKQTIFASLLIAGISGVVLLVVTSPGYVLPGLDPVIVPTLADALLSHPTTMDVYRPGDPGFAYPPGYPILFSAVSKLLTPLLALFVFKTGTIILVLLLPIGWAWMASRIFCVPLPAWLILLLSYIAFFGLERTALLTLEAGKNAQVLAGAVFPFLIGLLLIATRSNIGIPFAIAALAGATLLHYSAFYMVATFFAAYCLVHLPRERKEWENMLRLGFAGIVALGISVLLLRAALDDPRAGAFGWPDPVNGLQRVADVLLVRYNDLLFVYNEPSSSFWLHSPYRGLFLVGCVLVPLALRQLWRGAGDGAFAATRMAGIFGIMCLIGVALGTGAIKIGITSEFARWYLIFPQAALMLSALCAVACYARSKERGARVALCALGGTAVLGSMMASVDLAHVMRTYRAEPTTRSDLTNVRDVLSDAAPCFLITQSKTVADGLHTVQEYRPLEYAELLTGCRISNGSFVQRGIPDGRAMAGLPTAAALASLPPRAAIFLIVPESVEAAYHDALSDVEFARQQTQIGPLPVWRIRLGPNLK